MVKTIFVRYLLLLLCIGFINNTSAKNVSVYLSAKSSSLEQLAASELIKYLNQMYPADKFFLSFNKTKSVLINLETKDAIRLNIKNPKESFHIFKDNNQLYIQGGGDRGLLYGVYAFLESIGCYFRLSDEYVPDYENHHFNIPQINLKDYPLAKKRIIFNWHNFLSGCSSWNLMDWEYYIRQAVKLRFNTLMVHCYGNNPMIQFSYNGQTKPVGYLASTNLGRTWSTEHVNDVRNMVGASNIYSDPIFASKAALVKDKNRYKAAKILMQNVFDYAHKWGMKVLFSYDMDTRSTNPQNIIRTLSPRSLISVGEGDFYLVNPDTKEGYNYYKSQLKQILNDYPQIDEYAVWNRANTRGAGWGALRKKDMPITWKNEFQRIFLKRGSSYDCVLFGWAKIMNTYNKILKDIGRGDIQLVTGSWGFNFLKIMDQLTDKDISFLPLDASIDFEGKESQSKIQAVSSSREIIPILWAHHDDRTYVGRPYRPYKNIADVFKKDHISNFGIIHWMTRPLNCYFKNTMYQLWASSKNQSLETTLTMYSNAIFKDQNKRLLFKEYLINWMRDAPNFGRETSDRFIDHKLKNPVKVIKDCADRIELLESIPLNNLSGYALDALMFHVNYEKFIHSFFEVQSSIDYANEALKKGDLEKAIQLVTNKDPKEVINYFSSASQEGKITRGEMGLLVALNTTWLPYVISFKQSLGLMPISYIFGVTKQEELAQGQGRYTFYFDDNKDISEVLGEKETGLIEFWECNRCKDQFCGVIIDSAFDFTFKPLVGTNFQRNLNGNLYLYVLGMNNQKTHLSLKQKGMNKIAQKIIIEGKENSLIILPVHFTGKSSTILFNSNGPFILNKMIFKPTGVN